MLEVIGGGLILVGIAFAENRGWLDREKVGFIVNVGMQAGICGSLLYFIHKLSIWFL
ncbi:hypothetical protein P4533_03610 [Geobacillus stearothermophilus]|uniref:hypothetical protein n=1 Tax=Geobacillus stearothermophilus TaxID=1422 RepID=UPI002E1F5896|nr:hypothetical protein [Geobacillus stearothermophilus]